MNKNIFIYILFFLFFTTKSFACYLCTVTDPTVYAFTKLYSDQKHLNYIEVKWEFSRLYAGMSAQKYDKDLNGILGREEMAQVHKDFFEILKDNKYNTTVYINNTAIDIMDKIFDEQVTLTYKKLESSFKIKIDKEITNELSLMIDYIDNNGILAYFIKENGLTHNILAPLEVDSNIEDFTVPLEIIFYKEVPEEIKEEPKTATTKTGEPKEQSKSVSIVFAELLSDTSYRLHQLIIDIKENNSSYSLFLLLFFSFIYGIIHAAGPGHGKSLVASYMLSHNKDMKKAFTISALIAFVHVFSAFSLTFGIYFLMNELFSKYLDETEMVITKISGVIIILIAISMIYKKYKISRENKKLNITLHKPTCGCSACNVGNDTTDLGVIISAGIIPCPGTVTIFIFALSLQAYFVGFLAAIIMSIGMSLIIFITAALSIGFRKRIENNNLSKVLEYFSLVFILFLGIFLTIY